MKKITSRKKLALYGCSGMGVNMMNLIVGSYLCSALITGGFAPEEADMAVEAGCVSVTLGNRILRCETAPLYALTAISYELEL